MYFVPVSVIAFKSQFSATRSSEQTIGVTSYTKIAFNSELYDLNDEYDYVTNFRWSPDKPGIYSVGAHIEITAINDGKMAYIDVVKNGSDIVLSDRKESGGLENLELIAVGDIMVAEGDYFEVFIYQNDAATKQVASGEKCRFWAHRVI